MQRNDLTKKLLRELYIDYDMTAADIAKRLNASVSAIRAGLAKHGIHKTKRRMDKNRLREMYAGRMTLDEMSKRLGFGLPAIHWHAKKLGLKRRTLILDAALDRNVLHGMYVVEGKTIPEIADTFGCSPGTISSKLVRHGIHPRSRGARSVE